MADDVRFTIEAIDQATAVLERVLAGIRAISTVAGTASSGASATFSDLKTSVAGVATVAERTASVAAEVGSSFGRAGQESQRAISGTRNETVTLVATMEDLQRSIQNTFGKITAYAKESTLAAASTEMLGTALRVAGLNAGYTNDAMDQTEAKVKKLGIATAEARTLMTGFIQSQLNVADASKLARAAQDLAVNAQMDSSQAAQSLTRAISNQSVEMLRHFGMVTQSDQIFEKYGRTINKAASELTAAEKKQAFLNAVLEFASRSAGTYEAAMEDVGKQYKSMNRYSAEAAETIGSIFLPVMKELVKGMTETYKSVAEIGPAMKVVIGTVVTFVSATGALIGVIITAGTVAKAWTMALVALNGATGAQITMSGLLTYALGLQTKAALATAAAMSATPVGWVIWVIRAVAALATLTAGWLAWKNMSAGGEDQEKIGLAFGKQRDAMIALKDETNRLLSSEQDVILKQEILSQAHTKAGKIMKSELIPAWTDTATAAKYFNDAIDSKRTQELSYRMIALRKDLIQFGKTTEEIVAATRTQNKEYAAQADELAALTEEMRKLAAQKKLDLEASTLASENEKKFNELTKGTLVTNKQLQLSMSETETNYRLMVEQIEADTVASIAAADAKEKLALATAGHGKAIDAVNTAQSKVAKDPATAVENDRIKEAARLDKITTAGVLENIVAIAAARLKAGQDQEAADNKERTSRGNNLETLFVKLNENLSVSTAFKQTWDNIGISIRKAAVAAGAFKLPPTPPPPPVPVKSPAQIAEEAKIEAAKAAVEADWQARKQRNIEGKTEPGFKKDGLAVGTVSGYTPSETEAAVKGLAANKLILETLRAGRAAQDAWDQTISASDTKAKTYYETLVTVAEGHLSLTAALKQSQQGADDESRSIKAAMEQNRAAGIGEEQNAAMQVARLEALDKQYRGLGQTLSAQEQHELAVGRAQLRGVETSMAQSNALIALRNSLVPMVDELRNTRDVVSSLSTEQMKNADVQKVLIPLIESQINAGKKLDPVVTKNYETMTAAARAVEEAGVHLGYTRKATEEYIVTQIGLGKSETEVAHELGMTVGQLQKYRMELSVARGVSDAFTASQRAMRDAVEAALPSTSKEKLERSIRGLEESKADQFKAIDIKMVPGTSDEIRAAKEAEKLKISNEILLKQSMLQVTYDYEMRLKIEQQAQESQARLTAANQEYADRTNGIDTASVEYRLAMAARIRDGVLQQLDDEKALRDLTVGMDADKKKSAEDEAEVRRALAEDLYAYEVKVATASSDTLKQRLLAAGILTREEYAAQADAAKKLWQETTAAGIASFDTLEKLRVAWQEKEVLASRTWAQNWGSVMQGLANVFGQISQQMTGSMGKISGGIGGMIGALNQAVGAQKTGKTIQQQWGIAKQGTFVAPTYNDETGESVAGYYKGGNAGQMAATGIAAGSAVISGISGISSALQAGSGSERMLGAAQAGASAGSAFGPWGAVAGAAVGVLVAAIKGKPDWQKLGEDIGKKWGKAISDGLAKEIDAKSKEIDSKISGLGTKGQRSQYAAALATSKIIDEVGGITTKNMAQVTSSMDLLFGQINAGSDIAGESVTAVGEAFTRMVTHLDKNLKGIADTAFLDFIKKAKASKTEIEGVTAFLKQSSTQAISGFSAVAAAQATQQTAEINAAETRNALMTAESDAVAALAEARRGASASAIRNAEKYLESVREAMAKNKTLLDRMGDATKVATTGAGANWERMGRFAAAAMAAAIASGKTLIETFNEMGPGIDALVAGQEASRIQNDADKVALNKLLVAEKEKLADLEAKGLGASEEALALQARLLNLEKQKVVLDERLIALSPELQSAVDVRKWIGQNQALAAGMDGLNQMMKGLTNSGVGTQQMFDDFGAEAVAQFRAAEDSAAGADNIFKMMQPSLQTLFELQSRFGFAIDETTLKLLEDAEAAGVVGDLHKSASDRMVDGIDRVVGRLDALLKKLGVELPDAMDAGADKIVRGLGAAGEAAGRFGKQTASAAQDAQAAMDALSFGSSPGGIKEIPLQLLAAIQAAQLFSGTFSEQMGKAKVAADTVAKTVASIAIDQPIVPPLTGPWSVDGAGGEAKIENVDQPIFGQAGSAIGAVMSQAMMKIFSGTFSEQMGKAKTLVENVVKTRGYVHDTGASDSPVVSSKPKTALPGQGPDDATVEAMLAALIKAGAPVNPQAPGGSDWHGGVTGGMGVPGWPQDVRDGMGSAWGEDDTALREQLALQLQVADAVKSFASQLGDVTAVMGEMRSTMSGEGLPARVLASAFEPEKAATEALKGQESALQSLLKHMSENTPETVESAPINITVQAWDSEDVAKRGVQQIIRALKANAYHQTPKFKDALGLT